MEIKIGSSCKKPPLRLGELKIGELFRLASQSLTNPHTVLMRIAKCPGGYTNVILDNGHLGIADESTEVVRLNGHLCIEGDQK
jgi:hypothetical protein